MAEQGESNDLGKVAAGFEDAKTDPPKAEPKHQALDGYIPTHVLQAQERVAKREREQLEEQIRALTEKIEKDAPKKRETELEQAIAKAREQWTQDELQPLREKLAQNKAEAELTKLKQAIHNAGVRQGVSIEHVATVLQGFFHESEDWGTVLYENGSPVVDPDGTPQSPYMTYDNGVAHLAGRPDFAWAFGPRQMVGSPNYAGGSAGTTTPTPPQHTRKELASSPVKMAAFMEAERAAGRDPTESLRNLPKE